MFEIPFDSIYLLTMVDTAQHQNHDCWYWNFI